MPTPDKTAKNNRTLDMYVRLCEGKAINKTEEAQRYGVNARSIQRDIDDIRAFLDERTQEGLDHRTIEYDRARKGFVLEGEESALMNNSEILAVSKILLESRAFTKKEMNRILDKLVSGCVPQKNMKLVVDLLANERHHYVELNHRSQSEEVLWDLGAAVKNKYLIEMKYLRQSDKQSDGKRYVEPVTIIFSEYYFYLIGYLVEKPKEDSEPVAKYDYPAVFRVDEYSDAKVHPFRKFRAPFSGKVEHTFPE